jgi:hypothetical protein
MRLIRNKTAADSITIYDNEAVQLILNQQDIERNARNDILYNKAGKILDAYVWDAMVDNQGAISRINTNPPLLSTDPKLINDFVIMVVYIKTAYRLTNGNIETTIKSAENLIGLLKKEYHLD